MDLTIEVAGPKQDISNQKLGLTTLDLFDFGPGADAATFLTMIQTGSHSLQHENLLFTDDR